MSSTLEAVDIKILKYLNPAQPKSFFLFAGAGSGKTRTLVTVLESLRETYLPKIQLYGKRVAVITYTNAACDEIKERLSFDQSFYVSTIHSFAWELIKPFTQDIKEWLSENISKELIELEEAQRKGRPGTKAEAERTVKLVSYRKRLDNLKNIVAFSYNPNGINNRKDSLNHAEVIKLAGALLSGRPLLQMILIGKFPILLIDESQDTQKDLITAFMLVQQIHSKSFCLGLLGDLMQRIYSDGKEDLGSNLPENWAVPEKLINYRCPKRIVQLINKIRESVDTHQQTPAKSFDGFTRLFIVDSNAVIDRLQIEEKVANEMAKITADKKWKNLRGDVKTLLLEHHMAAKRGGFGDFFSPLYELGDNKTGAIDGTLNGVPFLTKVVLPLISSIKTKSEFAIAQLVKKHSTLITQSKLMGSLALSEQLKNAQEGIDALDALLQKEKDPTVLAVLKILQETNLLIIPEVFLPLLASCGIQETLDDEERDTINISWERALQVPLEQLTSYSVYIEDKSSFGTHQGVKGLQFPRVQLVLDDEDSRGFMFSYEKLLGAKEPTSADKKNTTSGKETGMDRTRRLFYVTCSRAEESLAIVIYTKKTKAVKNFVLENGWFSELEVIDFEASVSLQ